MQNLENGGEGGGAGDLEDIYKPRGIFASLLP